MNSLESTKASLLQIWKERDIQITVLTSLMMQLFLLFTGNLRRRKLNGFLRFIVWLAYVGADAVAVFAIGLFFDHDENYRLRSKNSSGDQTLPFVWAPFLLLHLGGQDTITAFSIEDNNLWLRHLLNLVVQVTLTMYVLGKSFEIQDLQLQAVAIPIFVAGTIKYGERTWALYSGSRDYLGGSCNEGGEKRLPVYKCPTSGDDMTSYALNTVLRVRGMLVGRTLFQLGEETEKELVHDFAIYENREEKFKVVMMELGMMYDILYTKAMVLRSWTGHIIWCIAEMCIVVAFVLFLVNRKLHHHNTANITITYTLFIGAIFMEAYSFSMVIISPWTWAGPRKGTFLNWLPRSVSNVLMQRLSSLSIGQFNLTDYSMSEKCTPRLIFKVITSLGLENKWRNFRHIQHIKVDKEMSDYIVALLCSGEGSQQLNFGRRLNYVLSLPFEHALFRLHIFTDMHLSSLNGNPGGKMEQLAAECKNLSQYFIYLMAVYPSMLPVSTAAQDLEHNYAKWARDNYHGTMIKSKILNKYAEENLNNETISRSPFEIFLTPSVASLMEMKEVWVRLLIYAAGKCSVEVHARQLGNGLELLTVVWLLMLHHGFGDVGKRGVNRLASDDPNMPKVGSVVPGDQSWSMVPRDGPLYAFEFHHIQDALQSTQDASMSVAPKGTGSSAKKRKWNRIRRQCNPDNSLEAGVASEMQKEGHVARGIDNLVHVLPEIEQNGE